MARTVGASQYRLTQEERKQLHEALFARLLHEVKDGSLTDAERAVGLMQGNAAGDFMEAFLGDNRVFDEAGDGTRFCGPDSGESAGLSGGCSYRPADRRCPCFAGREAAASDVDYGGQDGEATPHQSSEAAL